MFNASFSAAAGSYIDETHFMASYAGPLQEDIRMEKTNPRIANHLLRVLLKPMPEMRPLER